MALPEITELGLNKEDFSGIKHFSTAGKVLRGSEKLAMRA